MNLPPEARDEEDFIEAELVNEPEDVPRSSVAGGASGPPFGAMAVRPRRRRLPLVLFLLTCCSVFWAGVWRWAPHEALETWLVSLANPLDVGSGFGLHVRRAILHHGWDALIYVAALLGILATHEMGHFLMSVRYRIRASFPYFLPLPISPVGTLGAVIGMDGRSADRREIFDIGLAGPLAGLAVAVPIMWIGIARLDCSGPAGGPYSLDLPLALKAVLAYKQPPGYDAAEGLSHSHLNPFFMAGWVGLLITGLNMLPVSQLDGGHVIYGLFGRKSRWIARGFLLLAVGFIAYLELWSWIVMLILILIMGADHPPTRDDDVKIGWFRTILGWLSLTIPILCFPPRVFLGI